MRELFDYSLIECGAYADSTVMIGDNADADILGARNAGWHTIYFNIKGTAPCHEADANVNSLLDVKKIL